MSDWKSLIVLAIILFGVAYVILSYVGLLPNTMKDFVTYVQANQNLFAFCLCFVVGGWVLVTFLQSRKKSSGRPSLND